MSKKSFMLFVFVAILAGCSSKPIQSNLSDTKDQDLASCIEAIKDITPYSTGIIKVTGVDIPSARALSIEEMMSICAPGPCKVKDPMSEDEFLEYTTKDGKKFSRDGVKFNTYKKANFTVVVAEMKNAKSEVTQKDGQITINKDYTAQVIHNGQPCGVWDVKKK